MGEHILDWRLAKMVAHGFGFGAAGFPDGAEVLRNSRIDARLEHGRHPAVQRLEPLGEGARGVVPVPIEGRNEIQPLHGFQPDGVDIGDDDVKGADSAAIARNAELARLLQLVDEVGTPGGQHDQLGAGCRRLHQIGRVIGLAERMEHAADDGAAVGSDDLARGLLQRVAGGIVLRDDEPAFIAALQL